MDFNEAKEFIKNSYSQVGLDLFEEHATELLFRYSRAGGKIVRVSEQEINEVVKVEDLRSTFENSPVECSICSENYREHVIVQYHQRGPVNFFIRRENITFGNPSNNDLYAEIGPASPLFINFFRFDDDYIEHSLSRLRLHVRREPVEVVDMHDTLFRPSTIRIYNLRGRNIDTALKRSTQIIDTCLFELSYLKNIPLKLGETWYYHRSRVKPFRFEDYEGGNQLPLRQAKFNPDLIRFYQRGMGTDDPVDQFLSFYHVLEYFFVAVSDEQLYNKLTRRINDPKFAPTPTYLDRIIQDTLGHNRETDEIEMLKLVINKYIEEVGLIEFIKAYEEYLGDKIYTKKHTIFGASLEVKTETGHVIGNLAKRVKVIRNALVHSSDRYERQERYVPTTDAERMIEKEIPLMKFLAEKVIISSAE